jgi:hypothetical protein
VPTDQGRPSYRRKQNDHMKGTGETTSHVYSKAATILIFVFPKRNRADNLKAHDQMKTLILRITFFYKRGSNKCLVEN